MAELEVIDSFRGEFSFLSNFFIEPDRTHVEGEFQAEKTFDLRDKVAILSQPEPGPAKKIGRRVTLRADWEDVKVEVMRSLVLRKFLDHERLSERLVETGDAQLIEGNHWGDTFWGVCNQEGKNTLGLILMEIRALIKSYG